MKNKSKMALVSVEVQQAANEVIQVLDKLKTPEEIYQVLDLVKKACDGKPTLLISIG